MSIEAFAYEHGFAIQTVKSWESHAAEVSEASLERISRALKIPFPFFDTKNDPHKELAGLN
jgi:transcriptional regulator with XRE-family HTH domain